MDELAERSYAHYNALKAHTFMEYLSAWHLGITGRPTQADRRDARRRVTTLDDLRAIPFVAPEVN